MKNLVDFGHLDKSMENFVSLDIFVNFDDIEDFAYLVEREYKKF